MATLTTSYSLIAEKQIGTISGSGVTTKYLYLRIYAKYNSQSVANNQSTVSYQSRLYVTGNGTYFYTGGTTSKSLSGSGASSKSGDAQGNYYLGETTLYTISGTVSHNNSTGEASVSASASWSSSPWGVSGSVSGTASLPTIPRASTITSAGNVTLGNKCSIKWTPKNSSFKYKIKFSLGNWSHTTDYISPNSTSAYTYTGYTIPNTSALLDDISSSTTGTMTATLSTYNSSGTQIGSASSKTFTVTVPISVAPTIGTITLDPSDINNQNRLIQGKNKLTISVSGCTAGTGSSIKSYTFSGPGISSTTTNTSVTSSGTISDTGTLTYTVTVTDNRGRTASESVTIRCYEWFAPSINLSAYRVDTNSSTVENDSGTHVRCEYNLSYADVDETNDITVKIYYKKNTVSTWSSATVLTDSTTTSGSYVLNNIDVASTYTVYAIITDNYSGSSESNKITIFSSERIINVRPKGSGIAFGKMAEYDDLFDCKWAIRTGEPAQTMNNLSLQHNAITSVRNDTVDNWVSKGNLATSYYNATGQINGQPSQYGFLLNLTNNGTMIHQLWTKTAGSLFHRSGNSDGMGDWKEVLDTNSYTKFTSTKPTTLYSTTTGNTGTITLSQSAADFTYLEIFYTDNNSRQSNSVKIYSPNGKYVTLCCVEPSTANNDVRVYIRTSGWTISGTSMTVGRTDLSGKNDGIHATICSDNTMSVTANKYIKIFRILGYK